jgi:hypothetical protein
MRAASNSGAIRGLATAGSGAAKPNPSDGVARLGLSEKSQALWLAAIRHRQLADEAARKAAS